MTPQRRRLDEARDADRAAWWARSRDAAAHEEHVRAAWARLAAEAAYLKHLSDIRHHTSRRTRARRHA